MEVSLVKGFQSVEGSPGQVQHATGGVMGAQSVFLEDQSGCLPNALGRLGSAEASGWKVSLFLIITSDFCFSG